MIFCKFNPDLIMNEKMVKSYMQYHILFWYSVSFGVDTIIPGTEVIKLFSCSAQLSIKFELLINTKHIEIEDIELQSL